MTPVRTSPGRIFKAELEARGLSANRLAPSISVPANRITSILRGVRAVTAEAAVRLGRYLGTGPAFWMSLQSRHDISVVENEKGCVIERVVSAAAVHRLSTIRDAGAHSVNTGRIGNSNDPASR